MFEIALHDCNCFNRAAFPPSNIEISVDRMSQTQTSKHDYKTKGQRISFGK